MNPVITKRNKTLFECGLKACGLKAKRLKTEPEDLPKPNSQSDSLSQALSQVFGADSLCGPPPKALPAVPPVVDRLTEIDGETQAAETADAPQWIATPVPDLVYLPNFISRDEERSLIRVVDSLPWRDDYQRRTQYYGGVYTRSGLNPRPIPEGLQFLIERFVRMGVYSRQDPPTSVACNEYVNNQGIGAHVDQEDFGDAVANVSLLSRCTFRMIELAVGHMSVDERTAAIQNKSALRTGRVHDIQLEPRSLLVMRGVARQNWMHEIQKTYYDRPKIGYRRVSLTFRTIDRSYVDTRSWAWRSRAPPNEANAAGLVTNAKDEDAKVM